MRYGFNGMSKIGKAVENLFALYAISLNWTRKEHCESKALDIYSHVDQVYADENDAEIKIQIKDMRHESQGGKPIEDALCIELVNVNGRSGSVNGKYNYFVYRINNEFLIYNKEDIDIAIDTLVDFSTNSDVFRSARNVLYSRKGRKDTITLLPIKDLENINILPIYKIKLSEEHTDIINKFYYTCVEEAKRSRRF